jgi:hypothetical protein
MAFDMLVRKHSALINTSPETLLNVLLEHENLSVYFDAKFTIIEPEYKGELAGGRGCVREVRASGVRFLERITTASVEGISYNIIGNFPMKNHQGNIRFDRENEKTFVTYEISCEPLWYMPNMLLKYLIDTQILTALKNLRAAF